jgi:hypothetical protein
VTDKYSEKGGESRAYRRFKEAVLILPRLVRYPVGPTEPQCHGQDLGPVGVHGHQPFLPGPVAA